MGHRTTRSVRAAIAAAITCAVFGSVPARAQIADDFQSAGLIASNIRWGEANDLYTSSGEPMSAGSMETCGTPPVSVQIDRTFWAKVTGTGGPIVLSTHTSTIDTVVAVYQPNSLPSISTVLVCADGTDNAGQPVGRVAELAFNSVAGATYYTQWGSCVNRTPTPCSGTPGLIAYTILTNDAQAYPDRGDGQKTNTGAATEPGERTDCRGTPYGATVWFSYEAPAKGSISFEAVHLGGMVLAVYRGGAYFDCNVNAPGSTSRSQVTVPDAAKGERFLVQVGGRVSGGVPTEEDFTYRATFTESQDLDGDGFLKPPGPDCDDANPAIRPGAVDVPGNRIDEDCSAGDAPYPRLTSTVEVGARRGRLTLLRAKRVPAGATIRLSCNRRRCLRRTTIGVSRPGTVTLLAALRKRRLPAGTALTVTVTLPGHVGTVTTVKVGKKRRLSKLDACLPPGATRPVKC